jgi:bacterioferritin
MRDQATEGMDHASMAGEHVTSLGGPSLAQERPARRDPQARTSARFCRRRSSTSARRCAYYTLLDQARDQSVWLDEYAREQIQLEEQHITEVEKMMRKPGELTPAG